MHTIVQTHTQPSTSMHVNTMLGPFLQDPQPRHFKHGSPIQACILPQLWVQTTIQMLLRLSSYRTQNRTATITTTTYPAH